MRVTTDLWVSSIVRRAFSSGGFAAVGRRGATEAGAVFITLRDRNGELRLLGPAPQTSYDKAQPDERLFVEIARSIDEEDIQKRLDRELRFDSDVWVVELEVDEAALENLVPVTTP